MKKTVKEDTSFAKFERFMKKLIKVPKEAVLNKKTKSFPLENGGRGR